MMMLSLNTYFRRIRAKRLERAVERIGHGHEPAAATEILRCTVRVEALETFGAQAHEFEESILDLLDRNIDVDPAVLRNVIACLRLSRDLRVSA